MTNRFWHLRLTVCVALLFGPWLYVVIGDYDSFPYSTFPMFSYFSGKGSQKRNYHIYQINKDGTETLIKNERFLWPLNNLWLTERVVTTHESKMVIDSLMQYYALRASYLFKNYPAPEKPTAICLKKFTVIINLASWQIDKTSSETISEKSIKYE